MTTAVLVCTTCVLIVARTYLVDKTINSADYVEACRFSMPGLYSSYPIAAAYIESDGDWGIKINGTEALGSGSGVFKWTSGLVKPGIVQNGPVLVEMKGNVKINDLHLVTQCAGVGCNS